MTSFPAATWSSYRVVPPLSAVTPSTPWQLALCLLRVRWATPAFSSSLPPGVFFSSGMYQTVSKGSAVARREGKYWHEATNRAKNFWLQPIRLKLLQLCRTQKRLAVVLMAQCDYLHWEKRVWEIMWLSKGWIEHTPLTVLWLVSQFPHGAACGDEKWS